MNIIIVAISIHLPCSIYYIFRAFFLLLRWLNFGTLLNVSSGMAAEIKNNSQAII